MNQKAESRVIEGTALREGSTKPQGSIDQSAARPPARVSPNAMSTQPEGSASLLDAIARAASNPSIDMDKVERLYKMHQTEQDRQAEAAFNAAMARAQLQIVPVVKNAYNDHTKSQYAKLDAINDVVMPIIAAEGLSVSFNSAPGAPEGMLRTTAILAHAAGFKREYYYDLPLDGTGIKGGSNKTELHAIGSTSSYARRYLICLMFNVATEDDTDGNVTGQTGKGPKPDESGRAALEACGSIDGLKAAWGKLTPAQRDTLNDVMRDCKKRIEDADKEAAR